MLGRLGREPNANNKNPQSFFERNGKRIAVIFIRKESVRKRKTNRKKQKTKKALVVGTKHYSCPKPHKSQLLATLEKLQTTDGQTPKQGAN
jgi:uncharacterized protein YkuJ